MKIVFAGTTDQAARVLRHLTKSVHEIVAVITREDAPVGRKRIMTASPVSMVAQEFNIPTIKANFILPEHNEILSRLKPELGVVIAYGALLKQKTLELPKYGWYNIHYSLLPKYRGAAPVQHALISGEKTTGVTIFKLDDGMDTGPVASQVTTEIFPDENSADLLDRLTSLGISALDEVLASSAANTIHLTPQVGEPSYAGKLGRADAQIDWSNSNLHIENLIRGLNPEPMAWTTLDGQHFRIISARRSSLSNTHLNDSSEPGKVKAIDNKIFVTCGKQSLLQITTVQPAGKSSMSAMDWFRGLNREVCFE